MVRCSGPDLGLRWGNTKGEGSRQLHGAGVQGDPGFKVPRWVTCGRWSPAALGSAGSPPSGLPAVGRSPGTSPHPSAPVLRGEGRPRWGPCEGGIVTGSVLRAGSTLGRTVDFELYAQYLWERHTTGNPGPRKKEPRDLYLDSRSPKRIR